MRSLSVCVALATLLTGVLVAGCGGSDSGSGGTTTTETRRTLDKAALQALDYTPALLSPADLQAAAPGSGSRAKDTFDISGRQVRATCRPRQVGPPATAGTGIELQDAEPSFSITTSVQAFATEDEAKAALAETKVEIDSCGAAFMFEGDSFQRIAAPPIPQTGDEDLALFRRKTDTRLQVGDHFVRKGQFVYGLRYATELTSPLDDAVVAVGTAGAKKFVAWADLQTR